MNCIQPIFGVYIANFRENDPGAWLTFLDVAMNYVVDI
jgi:hypothetical protein